MPAISIVNTKGGVGKSTTTLNLAPALAAHGHKVLVVDGDPQGSIARWAKMNDETGREYPFNVIVEPNPVIDKYIGKVNPAFDFVLIDTPPSFREQMDSVLHSSDYLIVPLRPGWTDLMSTQEFLERYKPPKERMRLLINCRDRRTSIGKGIRLFINSIGIPVFRTEIPLRTNIEIAWMYTQTVDQYAPKGEETKLFRELGEEILQWVRK